MTGEAMLRLLILMIWFVLAPSVQGAEEQPTFVIESERFAMAQANDYRIGNLSRPLSEVEMLKILDEHAYEKTDQFEVKHNQYLYFVYVVDNRSDRPQTVYLRYPLWFPDTQTWLQQDRQLIPLRRYPRWGDTFYIELPPGVHRMVGMRLSATEQQGRANGVWMLDFESLENEWRGNEILMSVVFGAVVTMIFYNFGMYLVYRRIYFLFYLLYSGAALYVLAMMSGYFRYDMPLMSLGGCLGAIALLLFCNTSLNVKQKFPKLYWVSMACALLCILLSAYSMYTAVWLGFSLSMPLVMSYCLAASIFSLRSGYRPALYFVLGWGIFLVCCVIVLINIAYLGLAYLGYLAVLGFAAEISLFSFAIGQKVRLSEQAAMRANQHAFNQLKKVFYPHQINKIKIGLAIEDTMPTSEKEACAICFDIIGSTGIESTLGRSFIENSVKACVSALTEHYDGESMVATGYRVKEMGDGFLCTVGYPFRTFDGQDPAAGAIELALNFVRIFQSQVDELASNQLIFCSVSLAFGNIQGHFPKVGVAEYEVDGRAMDLAQRYESFRKRYFPEGPGGHIITVHAALFEQLPPYLQRDFVKVDLLEAQIVMRDDPGALHLYYCLLNPDAVRDHLQISA